jgi:hypothetical protein
MAGLDGESVRPDAPVFRQVAVDRLGLLHRRPFLGVADIHQGAENLLDADLGVVRRAGLDKVALILEALRLPDLMAWAAGKLAVRALLPADAVLDRLDPASACFPELPALADGSAERVVLRHAVAALCIPDAAPSAA